MSQPFDIYEPIWSESVVLGGGDADTSFSARLCRYPSAGVAWVWSHIWMPGRTLAYNVDFHRCSEVAVEVEGPDVVYEATDIQVRHRRFGNRDFMDRADLLCEIAYHESDAPPNEPGPLVARIEATLEPRMSGQSRAGRQEVRGVTRGTITVDGREIDVSGGGHWHEQHQTEPRWIMPFTYVNLRGEGTSVICMRGARPAATGFAQIGDRRVRCVGLDIDPEGDERRFTITLQDGETIAGTATAARRGSVYIYGKRRPGTHVVVDGGRLAGTINDWEGMPQR